MSILILILLAQYATWVVAAPFNESDDLQSYLVFPQKMLQTGHLGADPFSERRIIASLGGQWFLAAIALAHAPEPFAHLLEPGLGILLLVALICGSFREWRSWLLVNTGLVLLIFFQPPVANVTMLAIGSALFVALFRSVSWFSNSPPAPLRNAFIVSLLSAALMTGKSTFVPPCGAFLVISYLWRIFKSENRKSIIAETIFAIIFTIAWMMPWMVSSYRSGNTLFYPFLGKGYHASRYGVYEASWSALANRGYLLRQMIAVLVSREVITLGLLVAAAWMAGVLRFRQRNLLLPVMLSVAAGMLTIFVGGGGCGAARYDFPFLFAAILVLLPEILTVARSNSLSPPAATTATALVCLAVGVWVGGESAFQIAQRIQSVGTALKMARAGTPMNADLRSPALEARYADMQQHVPAGETLICHLEKPYLLNFNRNPVYIVDWAGGQSPPPGMPFFKGPEALADYLTGQGLRYLAYSYANQAGFSHQAYADRIGPDAHPWIRSESKCTFDFQDNIDELRKTRKALYDDGDICLIDLAQPK